MAKIDRSILQANDQSMGQYGDPDKIESSINHLADKIDENDTGFSSHKDAAELAHPDKSVTERKLGDLSVSRRTIQPGAVGSTELDDALLDFYGDIAVKAKLDTHDAELANVEKRYVNIDKYESLKVAVADGYDYAPAIQKALQENKNIVITGSYKSGRIVPRSGQEILIFGDITSLSGLTNCLIEIVSSSDISIKGMGKLFGNAEVTFSGIKVNNSKNIRIQGLSLNGFKNKGIDVSNGSTEVYVEDNTIDGSDSTTGAGVSVFGTTTNSCVVRNNRVKNSRFGIAVNGGYNHIIDSNLCLNNNLGGIAIDGVVTDSGDGTKESTISNNIVKGSTGTTYGGIYLGNGSSYNIISNNLSILNSRSGLRIVGGVGFECKGNKLIGNIARQNSQHGCEISYAPFSEILGNTFSNNTQRGISAIFSDNCLVNSNFISENGTVGIQWQSGKSNIQNNKVKLNNQGLVIAYGGSAPSGNTITGNDFSENTTTNVTTADVNTFKDNLGYITKNYGVSSAISSGGKITHGLSKAPTKVNLTQKGTAASTLTGITVDVDATNITVYFGGTGQAVFYWDAETN